ncbi:MAG: flavodoxin reductase, partial [Deltaproteobacteria bacterium]|nr:flavodoxin reductase [Deltaproteobacteria bacterium]
YLEKILPDTSRYVYVCGPDKFVEDITAMVKELGVEAEALVFEE